MFIIGFQMELIEKKMATNWLVNGAASRLRADADRPLATAPNVARKSYLSRDLHLALKATYGAVTKAERTSYTLDAVEDICIPPLM